MKRAPLSLLLLALLLATGCQPRDFRNENDRLRADNLELEHEVAALQKELARRAEELARAREQAGMSTSEIAGDYEVPQLHSLHIDRYSGIIKSTQPGQPDLLRVYLETRDQQRRFIPVAGTADLQAAILTPGQSPRLVGELTIEPAMLDRAYRDGMFGRHYTLEMPLPRDVDAPDGQITVKVTFTQARTGRTLSVQQAMRLP